MCPKLRVQRTLCNEFKLFKISIIYSIIVLYCIVSHTDLLGVTGAWPYHTFFAAVSAKKRWVHRTRRSSYLLHLELRRCPAADSQPSYSALGIEIADLFFTVDYEPPEMAPKKVDRLFSISGHLELNPDALRASRTRYPSHHCPSPNMQYYFVCNQYKKP